MRGPIVLLGGLSLAAGAYCAVLAAALSGDRSVSMPFQIATMVLGPGGLLMLGLGLALPSKRARLERVFRDLDDGPG